MKPVPPVVYLKAGKDPREPNIEALTESVESDAMTAPESSKTRASLRAAINAMCKGCIYDKFQPGNWRQQVEACTSPGCPLYPVRPVSSAKEAA